MRLYLLAFKKFKGFFSPKWTGEWLPLLMTPLTSSTSALFIIGAGSLVEEDTYFCPLVLSLPASKTDEYIQSELDKNTKRKSEIVVLETLFCSVKFGKSGRVIITPKKKGKFIQSILTFEMDSNQSTSSEKVFKMQGVINLDIEAENMDTMRMNLMKKMALFKGLKRT